MQSILIPILLLIFIATGLIWLTQILKLLYLIDKGTEFTKFFQLILLIIPSLLFVITPFVTVVGIIFVYNRLSQERQLIILKNFGLSNFKIARPALLFSIFMTIFCYYLSLSLMPASYNKLKNDILLLKESYVTKIISAKTFNQISKKVIIFVNENSANGELKGLVIFDNRNDENSAILFARSGIIKINGNAPTIYLKEGSRQAYDYNHNLTELYFDNLSIEFNKPQSSNTSQSSRGLNEYYLDELLKPKIYHNKQEKSKLIAEGHQRLIWPLYSFVLTFLTLAIFLDQSYSRKSLLKPISLASLAITVITYLHFTSQNLAARNLKFIYLSYLTLLVSMIMSIYYYNKKSL